MDTQIMKNGVDKSKRHAGRVEKAKKTVESGGRLEMPELRSRLEQKLNSKSEDVLITSAVLSQWKKPPFQREVRQNKKFQEIAEEIRKDGGILPGIIHIGILDGVMYRVDGQHRLAALEALIEAKALTEGLAKCEFRYFDSMGEMAGYFKELNDHIARMTPDDNLRAMEWSIPAMKNLRQRSNGLVNYGQVTAATKHVLSMSMILRVWAAATSETPAFTGSAMIAASALTNDEAGLCADFLLLCERAWGRDAEYRRLWASLNLSVCGWLYRRVVLAGYSAKSARLTADQFQAGITSLTSDSGYVRWLAGKHAAEMHRMPAYNRIKAAIIKTVAEETGNKIKLPAPQWFARGR